MSIEDKIDEAYEREGRDQRRKYIGASSVGGDCLAEQSFAFRGFPETPPSAKLKRIFKMGHVIEWRWNIQRAFEEFSDFLKICYR